MYAQEQTSPGTQGHTRTHTIHAHEYTHAEGAHLQNAEHVPEVGIATVALAIHCPANVYEINGEAQLHNIHVRDIKGDENQTLQRGVTNANRTRTCLSTISRFGRYKKSAYQDHDHNEDGRRATEQNLKRSKRRTAARGRDGI